MAIPVSADQAGIFAANRARGRIGLGVVAAGGITRRERVLEKGSLRVRFPGPVGPRLEAMLVNTAGGIAGGDRFALDITVNDGAQLAVTSTAAEKVYRSLGPDATIDLTLAVGTNGSLAWLPQETILFDGARLRRCIEVDLAESASLVLAEAVVFGRAAMGETVEHGSLFDRWRVRRGGRLVFAETVRLGDDIGASLRQCAVGAGAAALATLFVCPAVAEKIASARACSGLRSDVAVSAWSGFAVARFLAGDGAALRYDLAVVLAALGVTPPRLWLS